MAALLEVRDLSKAFSGPPLFSDLSFEADRGLFAVAGRNGSGKTTLLKTLAFLQRPDAGSVRVLLGGRALSGDERRRAVGWSGLDLALYDDLTASENLRFFWRAAGFAAGRANPAERLAAVGLAGRENAAVGELSSGMKQRLRIAFALLFDPPVLLLDEPYAGLDADGREVVSRIVAQRRRETLVLLASNDARDFETPDRVLELGSP